MRRKERLHGGVARKNDKGAAISGKMKAAKQKHQAKRKDAVSKYITQHVPGTYLTFEQRQTLAADWNELVTAGCRITMRQFAAKHGLNFKTWRREYHRGASGLAVPDAKDRRQRKYAEYDPFKAQDIINDNNANKGPRMLVTNQMAFIFRKLVVDDRPAGATNRSKFGHYEMDTVVSSTKGTGGLIVLIDRKSRRYVSEMTLASGQDNRDR